MPRALILAALLALLPALANADEVFLKGGGKISGRILSRTDTAVQVDVGAGIITVPMASVLSIEEKHSILDDYEERAAKLRENDVPGWLGLARWSLGQGLGTQARRAYQRVLSLNPQNVEANQALGRVLIDGRWVPEPEVHRARGLVEFEGAWMTPAERDAILAERDARFNELVQRDAERRVRDAEQRAADAEARAQQATTDAAWSSTGIPLDWGGGYGYLSPGYPSYPGYGRPYPGRPWRPSAGSTWPPMGMYPSYPIGSMWPSYPIGPAGSFPVGPSGAFPVGPSPPPSSTAPGGPGKHPGGGTGPHRGGSRPDTQAPAKASAPPPPTSTPPARSPGRPSPRP